VPEEGQQSLAKWHVSNWSLRTKVAVVLMLPAIVALVLGGIRVQSQLDEASRLSTVRDQLAVLEDSVALSDLVNLEMIAAVSSTNPDGVDLRTRTAAVDDRVAAIRRAADFARLPSEINRILSDALGRLGGLRLQAANATSDPITEVAGYLEVINGLADLVPAVVALANVEDLSRSARAVNSMLRMQAILTTEQALLRFGTAVANNPAIAAGAQRVSAEEGVLATQIKRDLPPAFVADFDAATTSTQTRREALQAAASGAAGVNIGALLPELSNETTLLNKLRGTLVTNLSDNVSTRTNNARSDALRDAALVLGALLAALAVALIVARSLLSPVRILRRAAIDAAQRRLPDAVERVRNGEVIDWSAIERVPVRTDEEIGQLARAFDDMQQQAVRLAGEQAELRRQVSEMFTTLSRRSQSLVELQLEVIENLESDEQDPRRLEELFRLDHLATRLRRNGENLQVLAGGSPARKGQESVTVVELLRAATSEISDYRRVSLGHAPNGSIRGSAAADIVHILAELLENATRFSSPQRKVVLTADRGADGGLLIEVVDGGLGMAPDDLAAANRRLSATGEVGPETTRRMGLYVVSRLAERHGVTVRLRPTYDAAKQSGITASVHVPAAQVMADGTPDTVRRFAPTQPRPSQPKPQPVAAVPAQPVQPQPATVASPPGHGWFVAEEAKPAPAAKPSVPAVGSWTTPEAEKAWRAATSALSRQPSPLTAAGLPQRKPGARVVPIDPARAPAAAPAAENKAFRDPEAIRSNLSRHYSGVRAARQRRQDEPDTETPNAATTDKPEGGT
jgi:signal transduction histidine kinase